MTVVVTDWTRPRPAGPVRPPGVVAQAARLQQVVQRLAGEFAAVLPLDVVSAVVDRACRDLFSEVPAESLAEFVFHSARQRLVDAVAADPMGPANRRCSAAGRRAW